MAFNFVEYDDRPFAIDEERLTVFSMGGSDRSKWCEISDPDSVVKIWTRSWDISESEAKELADDIAREWEEIDRAKGKIY